MKLWSNLIVKMIISTFVEIGTPVAITISWPSCRLNRANAALIIRKTSSKFSTLPFSTINLLSSLWSRANSPMYRNSSSSINIRFSTHSLLGEMPLQPGFGEPIILGILNFCSPLEILTLPPISMPIGMGIIITRMFVGYSIIFYLQITTNKY